MCRSLCIYISGNTHFTFHAKSIAHIDSAPFSGASRRSGRRSQEGRKTIKNLGSDIDIIGLIIRPIDALNCESNAVAYRNAVKPSFG